MFEKNGFKTARFVSAVTLFVAMSACSHSQTKMENTPGSDVPAVSENLAPDAAVSSDGKVADASTQTDNLSDLIPKGQSQKVAKVSKKSSRKKVSRRKKHKKHKLASHKKHVQKQNAVAEINKTDNVQSAAAGTVAPAQQDSMTPPPPPPPVPSLAGDQIPNASPDSSSNGTSAWRYVLFIAIAGGLLFGGFQLKKTRQKKTRRLIYNA